MASHGLNLCQSPKNFSLPRTEDKALLLFYPPFKIWGSASRKVPRNVGIANFPTERLGRQAERAQLQGGDATYVLTQFSALH